MITGGRFKVRTTWFFKANALMDTRIEPSESKSFSLNSQSLPLRYTKASRKRSQNITDQLIWWVTPFYLRVFYRKVMDMWKEHSPDNPRESRLPLQVQPLALSSLQSHSLCRPAFTKGTHFSKELSQTQSPENKVRPGGWGSIFICGSNLHSSAGGLMSLFLFTDGEIVGLGTAISISEPLSCTSNPNTTFSESFIEAEILSIVQSHPFLWFNGHLYFVNFLISLFHSTLWSSRLLIQPPIYFSLAVPTLPFATLSYKLHLLPLTSWLIAACQSPKSYVLELSLIRLSSHSVSLPILSILSPKFLSSIWVPPILPDFMSSLLLLLLSHFSHVQLCVTP